MQHSRAFSHRVYEWLRRRPYIADTTIVALLVLPLLPGSPLVRGDFSASNLVGLALAAPLLWRRRHPVLCFTLVSLGCFVQVLVLDRALPSDVAFLLALYAVSAYAAQLWARLGALLVGGLGAALALVDWSGPDSFAHVSSILLPLGLLGGSAALAWTLGDLLRTRRAYVVELEDRARRLERERDQQERLARVAERARIAREMHDVVAHSLSVVVAQADGGLYAGQKDARAAREALMTIGSTGRQALAEMRRLLGVLRSDVAAATPGSGPPDDSARQAGPERLAGSERLAELAPQPGLAALPDLVAQVRASGVPVELVVSGRRPALPEGVELAGYRIVQEALTNTLKHAGPGASAKVHVDVEPDRLSVRVCDDGRGLGANRSGRGGSGSGQGINGMRERVALYGGQLRAGPRLGGGFEVSAVLQLEAPRSFEADPIVAGGAA